MSEPQIAAERARCEACGKGAECAATEDATCRRVLLTLVPISIQDANAVVLGWHRHNRPVLSARFAIGAVVGSDLVGVAIIGRPVARHLDDGFTAEVVRVCTTEQAPKGTNSKLYAASWRAWRAMGGRKLITYTLQSEGGSSLRGAGWKVVAEVTGSKGWARESMPHLNRIDDPVYGQDKFRWEITRREQSSPLPEVVGE